MLRHKAYGTRIRLLRESLCWTQQQLARAAGYSIKTIWKAESGRALKRQTLTDIASALEVQTEDIAKLPAAPKLRRQSTRSSAFGDPPQNVPQTFRKSSASVPT